MKRHPTTQDVTWFLDLHANNQLDLNPPYQRRSVWTRKDRQFFMDTVFRGYPSPAIYLDKEMREGTPVYHVIDGKQRIETLLMFNESKLRLSSDFGDTRLSGRVWKDIKDVDIKNLFWDYQLPVELISALEEDQVNNIFDRLNRNSRKLDPQELRHAKYDGWFITTAEQEAEEPAWQDLGVSTHARAKRMRDIQFISELLLVVIEQEVIGFDQAKLDDACAEHDDPASSESTYDYDDIQRRFRNAREFLVGVEKATTAITTFARNFGDFYSLWAAVVLDGNVQELDPEVVGNKFAEFIRDVRTLDGVRKQGGSPETYALPKTDEARRKRVMLYEANLHGAFADIQHRTSRHEALVEELTS